MNDSIQKLTAEAIHTLKGLIATPSYSREEEGTAAIIADHLSKKGVEVSRSNNNVYAKNKHFDASKPTILLNSHHDTVKPDPQYTLNPFEPIEKEGKLFGLGSNDAGGCLVSLMTVFLFYFERKDLKYNLIFAATAEEEISGAEGIGSILPLLPSIDCAIVGEPTQMQMATAERGLVVLDALAKGKAGHAARNEGENAIYKVLHDIEWMQQYVFDKVSPLLGPTQATVTVIETDNKAHNVVPAQCRFVVDIRVNELYTLEEVVDIIRKNVQSEVRPRSLRLRSSVIDHAHPLVQSGLALGRITYGSPTTSDKALMPFPSLKMGPGDSTRSHTADEFIYLKEIEEGIDLYIQLLNGLL